MKARSLYVGKAGQCAVMAELAWRGYNIAIPEIDIGDDVFAVRDETGAMWRLQAKASKETRQKTSSRYEFRVKEKAIHKAQSPELHFVFVMRQGERWRFLVMDRSVLKNYVVNQDVGTPAGDYRRISIVLHDDGRAICSRVDWRNHLEDWDTWHVLSTASGGTP